MSIRRLLAGSVLLAAAPFATAAPPPAGSLAANTAPQLQLPESLAEYRFVSALTVPDRANPLYGFHHFYANPKAWEVLAKEGLFPFPRGSAFVGLTHEVAGEGQLDEGGPRAILLMQKDASARETGGWRFATFKPDGTLVPQDTRTACFECHTRAKARDYVFSKIPDLMRRDLERAKPKKK